MLDSIFNGLFDTAGSAVISVQNFMLCLGCLL